MIRTRRRTRSISTKVTEDEYTQMVGRANPKTVSEWARHILVRACEPVDLEFLLLAEFLALRTILLNLHFSVADGGRSPSRETMKALIDHADAEKLAKAQRRVAELGGSDDAVGHPQGGDHRS